ncbi:glycoside hydrolase family 6 protein [Glycomyces sp. TRM65418]|uniref:glycoside hydrolase family 6 protein n=1 Tax=Glycomyces sp. TRM65418 TaxID=2867006 RepID=UPI001CE4D390|nr:glycoside hydrolase family 6 protein [Glycomyces sp. TRM65418]MCC3764418.1 glycoside hydrolase family 6 protein [Glycomyces sp. TRM65418]QZD54094.1 glycoside hydrolase family 6 protein [Glycomyces sp. TRM65418]
MKRRQRLAAIVAGAATAAVAALGAGFLLSPNAGAQDDVSAQAQALWTNPDTQAARWVAANPNDSRAAMIRDRIAETPAGNWFTRHNPSTIKADVESVVAAASADGAAPIMVVYNIPNRDCGGHSGGGAPDHQSYRQWVDQFAAGLSGPAYIVLEPDTLPHNCANESERQQINQSLTHAVQAIKNAESQAKVYIDIGHSNWLAPATAAQRLRDAGVQYADGFALNTSNYRTTEESSAYAQQIQNIIGSDKGAVIDTSRNGNGPAGDEWCDPAGRAIGDFPTTSTGVNGVDAFLWVKLPGEADGCAGSAGQFIPDLAYQLASNAGSDWPGDVEPTDPVTDPTSDDPTSDEPTTGGPGETDCTVHIEVVSSWDSGWQGKVSMTSDQAVNGWTVSWTWPGSQSVTSSWNTQLSTSGSTVTAKDVGWNASVAAGQTKELFGFVASGPAAGMEVAC